VKGSNNIMASDIIRTAPKTERKYIAKCFFPPCPVGLTHAYGVFFAPTQHITAVYFTRPAPHSPLIACLYIAY